MSEQESAKPSIGVTEVRMGKELADKMSESLNNFAFNEVTKEFVYRMSLDHRTLQQCFTGLCLAWIKHLAKLNETGFDGRNEASVEIAKKIVEAVGEDQMYLPFI